MRVLVASLTALALSACSLMPDYVRPEAAIPPSFPAGDVDAAGSEPSRQLAWRDVFHNPALQRLVERALANNQNLRVALANVTEARGLLTVQRAERLPRFDAEAGASVSRASREIASSAASGGGATAGRSNRTTAYDLSIGLSAFEIDLFGRVRSLSEAALQEYLATEAAVRAVRLTLIAETANAYLSLATDRSLLAIARSTETSALRSVDLVRARLHGGVAPRSDLRQAETVLAQARSDVANLTAVVGQDRNALELLVGTPVADAELPPSIESVESLQGELPAGLQSSVLLRRPDVEQAERQLQAANARIGAARAAFFPRISLTAAAGLASSALSALFSSGAFTWLAGAGLAVPIFDAGVNRGNLEAVQARRDAAIAQYQRTIQTGFREVADALARRGTIDAQIRAQQQLVDAAIDSLALVEARYRAGTEPFLATLDAQRTLYSATRALASARLVRATNRVEQYRSLGGDAS